MSNTSIQKRGQDNDIVSVPERLEDAVYYTPLVDIAETNDAFLFEADLPGVAAGDVDISFENGTLSIDAKTHVRQPANTNYTWREYGTGHFHRSFSLQTPIDVDGIRAEMKNGVLHLHVPKAASARTRKIEIKTS